MAGVKLFKAITLDTFAMLFTRIGIVDQVREELMEVVRSTGQQILDVWHGQYQAAGVPEPLIRNVEEHQAGLPLLKGL